MATKIVKINEKNEAEALKVLTSSIIDDPNKVYYFPEKEDRVKNSPWMIERLSKALSKFDEKYALVENSKIVAVAMWIPPGKHITMGQLLRYGILQLPFRIGFKKFLKVISSLNVGEKIQKEVTQGKNHWHLFYIGVDPNHQRKGFGSMILKPGLEVADKQKLPVFLQNFTVENTNFYQKNGFKVMKFYNFSDDILMRNMLREPQ
ncbi:MAG: GNAT family N-acetyltransferase [Spirochaetia bacterium]|nr:GNAT family N-acetyltransferase [Spirochaetia bacterium]